MAWVPFIPERGDRERSPNTHTRQRREERHQRTVLLTAVSQTLCRVVNRQMDMEQLQYVVPPLPAPWCAPPPPPPCPPAPWLRAEVPNPWVPRPKLQLRSCSRPIVIPSRSRSPVRGRRPHTPSTSPPPLREARVPTFLKVFPHTSSETVVVFKRSRSLRGQCEMAPPHYKWQCWTWSAAAGKNFCKANT